MVKKIKFLFRRHIKGNILLYRFFRRIYRSYIYLRVQAFTTKLAGLHWKRNHDLIELDITYRCNLKCFNCDRSCTQAPSNEEMSVEQINRFVDEAVRNKSNFKRIRILGGEPTLHSKFEEILEILLNYKHSNSPITKIEVYSNGYGKKVKEILSRIPSEVSIVNSEKTDRVQDFISFNIAPKDCRVYRYVDYCNGCETIETCGFGLTRYGYYPCALAGSIDRVFGFDIGRKVMPERNDLMLKELKILCKLCGHFKYAKVAKDVRKSESWENAYDGFKKERTRLSLY